MSNFHQWMCWKDLKDPYLTRIVCRLYTDEDYLNDERVKHPSENIFLVEGKDIELLRMMLEKGYIVTSQHHVVPIENYRPQENRFEFSIGVRIPVEYGGQSD